jgi:hypothetical protein
MMDYRYNVERVNGGFILSYIDAKPINVAKGLPSQQTQHVFTDMDSLLAFLKTKLSPPGAWDTK